MLYLVSKIIEYCNENGIRYEIDWSMETGEEDFVRVSFTKNFHTIVRVLHDDDPVTTIIDRLKEVFGIEE